MSGSLCTHKAKLSFLPHFLKPTGLTRPCPGDDWRVPWPWPRCLWGSSCCCRRPWDYLACTHWCLHHGQSGTGGGADELGNIGYTFVTEWFQKLYNLAWIVAAWHPSQEHFPQHLQLPTLSHNPKQGPSPTALLFGDLQSFHIFTWKIGKTCGGIEFKEQIDWNDELKKIQRTHRNDELNKESQNCCKNYYQETCPTSYSWTTLHCSRCCKVCRYLMDTPLWLLYMTCVIVITREGTGFVSLRQTCEAGSGGFEEG